MVSPVDGQLNFTDISDTCLGGMAPVLCGVMISSMMFSLHHVRSSAMFILGVQKLQDRAYRPLLRRFRCKTLDSMPEEDLRMAKSRWRAR